MDKSWMDRSRVSVEYMNGVDMFVKFAVKNCCSNGKILCPCRDCKNNKWCDPEEAKDHLLCAGFLRGYTSWVFHGEHSSIVEDSSSSKRHTFDDLGSSSVQNVVGQIDIQRLFQDVSRPLNEFEEGQHDDEIFDATEDTCDEEQPPIDTTRDANAQCYNWSSDYDQELYPGCEKFSKIAFLLRLFHLKYYGGMSSKTFTMLLELLKDAFPKGTTLPSSYYEAKKVIKELGLGYEKYHACPNDCMLYVGAKSNQESCHICRSSRWALNKIKEDDPLVEKSNQNKKKPAKILRYFPLIPRLKRLYASSKTSKSMRWHDEGRIKDGLLRHPADAFAWKAFDARYPDFAMDSRNVRLGLASDGFNPFRAMSTTYSTWPVVLVLYNMEPGVFMKQSSLALSSIIPDEKGPGNDIDVFLSPLIEELKQLWIGVDAFDAFTGQNFRLRAALIWTINDFPAYANLSGWSTRGRAACPCCGYLTESRWLKNGRKFCYMGHRRWLDPDHPFRFQRLQFDGTIELRPPPVPLSGSEVLKQVEGMQHVYGKAFKAPRKRTWENIDTLTSNTSLFLDADDFIEDESNIDEVEIGGVQVEEVQRQLWKKRSIFFDLPYWEYNLLRHNLDVMHVEKNVCDNLLGTLLNLEGKTKDNLKARLDLKDMGIRPELHPKELSDGKFELPPSCYTMSNQEKDLFLIVLKNLKVPDEYASNISRRVNLKKHKLSNLKSHDAHILMQDVFPIAAKASLSNQVLSIICELSSFFKSLCSKTLDPMELDQLEYRVALTLCHMEKVFPPGFFTIMVHLIIHLAAEAKLGGPVHGRWMYPIERDLMMFKSLVGNRAHPERITCRDFILSS